MNCPTGGLNSVMHIRAFVVRWFVILIQVIGKGRSWGGGTGYPGTIHIYIYTIYIYMYVCAITIAISEHKSDLSLSLSVCSPAPTESGPSQPARPVGTTVAPELKTPSMVRFASPKTSGARCGGVDRGMSQQTD